MPRPSRTNTAAANLKSRPAKVAPPTKHAARPSSLSTTDSSFSSHTADVSISSNLTDADQTIDEEEDDDDGSPATPTGRRSPDLQLPESDDESSQPSGSNVVVCVRVRPATQTLADADHPWSLDASRSAIEATDQHPSIAKRAPSSSQGGMTSSASSSFLPSSVSSTDLSGDRETYKFSFDSLVPPDVASLQDLYQSNLSPIISGAVSGFNGTIFAYGQTGSGKTYTMSGGGGEEGIIARAIHEVFERCRQSTDREFLLRVSYLEIYNESLRDLLLSLPSSASSANLSSSSSSSDQRPASPTKGGYSHSSGSGASSGLRIMEQPASGRITISGLREEIVTQPAQVLELLAKGQAARHQAATDWNERSSRSHCVATLTIESRRKDERNGKVRVSALNLIDLAGSERAATEKERRKEGAFINKSLLTLGSVISKLSAAASGSSASTAHIPYRDSKLTRLLQTSLSGNARVAVLLTMSTLPQHAAEGLSTLKFGKRCKMIKLKAKRGEVGEGDGGNEALLRRYKREVERLRAKLEQEPTGSYAVALTSSPSGMDDLRERRKAAQLEVEDMSKKKAELRAQMEHLTRLILTGNSVAEERQAQEEEDFAAQRPSTPLRRGRVSEFGTPGTPTRPISRQVSPIKRINGLDDRPATPKKGLFAQEVELAGLRKSLAAALEAKRNSESARAQEADAWSKRVEELEEELERNAHSSKQTQLRAGEGEARFKDLETKSRQLQGKIKKMEQAEKTQRESHRRDLSALQLDIDSLQSDLNDEQAKRLAAEATLAKRPETEEEVTQREFDELVLPARKVEEAKMLKSPLLSAAANLAPVGGSSSRPGSRLAKREKELDEREAGLSKREAEVVSKQAQIQAFKAPSPPARPLPVPCTHQVEIDELKRLLAAQTEKAERLQKTTDEEQKRERTPPSTGKSSTAIARGGSLKEYSRYPGPTTMGLSSLPSGKNIPSMASSSNLAASFGMSSSPSNNGSFEVSLKADLEEIQRLNDVITSQRNLMADLATSVSDWKEKMRSQQEIIKQLITEQEEQPSQVASTSRLPKVSEPAALPPSAAPKTSHATPTSIGIQPQAPSSTGMPRQALRSTSRGSNVADDFLKRRSAFLTSSDDKKNSNSINGGKPRPGSLFASSSPYQNSFTSSRDGIKVSSPSVKSPTTPTFGSSAPSSPNKLSSSLWTSSPLNGGPGSVEVPINNTTTTSLIAKQRKGLESELERLKTNSPRVDERTKDLLESSSPGKKQMEIGASRWGTPTPEGGGGSMKDWYI